MAKGQINADKRERLIAALAAGHSVAEAARQSGYARSYVQILLKKNPEVLAEVERRKAELVAAAEDPGEDEDAQGLESALSVLKEVANSDYEEGKTRVAAAAHLVKFYGAKLARKKPKPSPAAPPEGSEDPKPLRVLDPLDPEKQRRATERLMAGVDG